MRAKDLKAMLTKEVKLKVVPSGIAGVGLKTLTDLRRGQVIGFYEGRRFRDHEDRKRKGQKDCSYIFGLSTGELIDGSRKKMGKINHSCDPSTTVMETVMEGRLEIAFFATRDIARGEELTLNYGYKGGDGVDPAAYKCRCGASNCSGSMLMRPGDQ